MRKPRLWMTAFLVAVVLLAADCKTTPPAGQGDQAKTTASKATPGASGQAQAATTNTASAAATSRGAAAQTTAAAGRQAAAAARSTDRTRRTAITPSRLVAPVTARLRSFTTGALQSLGRFFVSVKKGTIDSEDFRGVALAVLILLGMSGIVVGLSLSARRRRRLSPSSSASGV